MRKGLPPALLFAVVLTGCAAQPGSTAGNAGAITMDHGAFGTETHEIPTGGTITFSNTSSRALHVLVVGEGAQAKSEPGAPSFGGASGHRADVGDRWTTPPWLVAGTYSVTCTLHPSMNLKVVVREP